MSQHDDLMRRVMSAINDRNPEQLRDDLTDDVVHHAGGSDVEGQEAVIDFYRMLCEQAGWKITPHAVASTGSWASAIHQNTFHSGSYEVTTSGRVRDGRIAELWTVGMPPLTLEELTAGG